MEQRELVERARRGDGDSFAALVQPHLTDMLRLAQLVGGARADAEDIVQESLTRVLRSLGRFDPDRPFRPWFATVVTNQARNWHRSGLRRQRLTRKVAGLADVGPPLTDDQALANVDGSSLVEAVATLEQIDREVLGLRFLLGMSERETADALHCSTGTVKSRTSRALARLRTKMSSESVASPTNAGANSIPGSTGSELAPYSQNADEHNDGQATSLSQGALNGQATLRSTESLHGTESVHGSDTDSENENDGLVPGEKR